jgi:hypothetical protein
MSLLIPSPFSPCSPFAVLFFVVVFDQTKQKESAHSTKGDGSCFIFAVPQEIWEKRPAAAPPGELNFSKG